jgi:hypothetical protein
MKNTEAIKRVEALKYRDAIIESSKNLNDVTALGVPALFKKWLAGEQVYAKDTTRAADVRQYNNQLYRCAQSHTTQTDWTPDITPALWVKVAAPAEIPVWKQPAGAHDAYQKDDKVHFPTVTDSVYQSTIANNVWSPTVYPAGWKKI